MTSKKYRLAHLAIALFAWAVIMTPPLPAQGGQKRVLSIYAFRPDGPGLIAHEQAYRRVLGAALGERLDYYYEVIDVARLPRTDYLPALREFIRRKYESLHFDLVIANGNTATNFAAAYSNELFPGSPVVFNTNGERSRPVPNSTGIHYELEMKKTVDLALQLQPKATRLFVVSGASEFDSFYARVAREQLKALNSRLSITFLDALPRADAIDRVANLPADSIIFFLSMINDGAKMNSFNADVVARISRAASAPVYGWDGTVFGSGIVGGRLASSGRNAEVTAALALRVLGGENPAAIPVMQVDLTADEVDWRQMQRWGLREDRLPPGTIVSFRTPTVWERYRGYIIAVSTVILAQLALIAALLVQRRSRRHAENALRESEALHKLVADTAPVLIWRSGVDKRRDFFNRSWLEFTGRSLEQELGDGWAEGMHPQDLEGWLKTYKTAFDAREPFRMEYRLRRSDGEYRWMLGSGIARLDSEGRFAGYIGSSVDITDRKQSEAQLLEAHAEISRVSRLTALGEFAASIGHEVRQPLTAIILNARSCLRGIANPAPDLGEVRAGLLDVIDAGRRAEEVIQRNRELFRHRTFQAAELDLNSVIREAVSLAAARLRERQVVIETALDGGLPLVSGDRIQLQQVLLNIIGNAIDAMDSVAPAARRIDIASSLTDDHSVLVRVRDYGAGLGNVDLQRMFAFSYTTKPTGTGVGLSLSKAIIEAHNGRLWAEQNQDCGATFCFSIPVNSTG